MAHRRRESVGPNGPDGGLVEACLDSYAARAETAKSDAPLVSADSFSISSNERILVTGPSGAREDQYVITAPPPGAPRDIRIWVVSDFGQSNSSSDDVRRSLTVSTWKAFNQNSLHANFALSLGDQSEDDTDAQLQANYFNEIQDVVRNSPLFTIPGNHDQPLFAPLERLTTPYARYCKYIYPTVDAALAANGLFILGLSDCRPILPGGFWSPTTAATSGRFSR